MTYVTNQLNQFVKMKTLVCLLLITIYFIYIQIKIVIYSETIYFMALVQTVTSVGLIKI